MKRLFSKFILWWYGYCPKHGIPKQLSVDLESGDRSCPECEDERAARWDARISKALERLGHTPD